MASRSFLPKAFGALWPRWLFAVLGLSFAFLAVTFEAISVQAGEVRFLHGHLPPAQAVGQPIGRLPETNRLRFALTLPLRNQPALDAFLKSLYQPGSPNYHQYLTSAQFDQKFGPAAQDYETVIQFAKDHGLEIVKKRDSRIVLDVSGRVADVEKAFHVTMRTYRHPTEDREFYAPDAEPSVDAGWPAFDVVGMGNYAVPRAMLHEKKKGEKPVNASGSETGAGYYQGSDFRNAYAPGVSLTGAGQSVGLLELDGYYTSDILNYEAQTGITNIPIINANADGTNYPPGSGDGEVSLDIEMAMAMAPGLQSIVVFQAGSGTGTTGFLDILDDMVSSNQIKQFSSSWGFTGGTDPNTSFDTEFQKMIGQGQSFFQASGDGDAWYNAIWEPADSIYLTSVGGTLLTMSGSGASYSSESVWNEGNLGHNNRWSPNGNGYIGSGGGVSTVYSIPYWQTNAINTTNQGSTTMRNVPDVALTGDDIWVCYNNGGSNALAGTSCAAPLWAGFMALVNQQAASNGMPSVGFINPIVYALGQEASYSSIFHDITSGNNTNASSHNLWFANTGYDLCTGWGTPRGAATINALLSGPLIIAPSTGFVSTGPGGPFSPTNQTFTLTNAGATSLTWSLVNTSTWLSATSSGGTLGPAATTSFNINLSSGANSLANGSHTNYIAITNLSDGIQQDLKFVLTVSLMTPVISWTNPASITYGMALTSLQLNAAANTAGSFVYTPAAGTVLTAGTQSLSVVFTPSNALAYSSATDSVSLAVLPAPLSVTASNATRIYGAANPTFTGSLVGVVNGDNITASYASSAMTNSPVGPYAIVPSLVDPQNRQTNYTVSLTNGTLTITMATPVLSWSTPSPITYGTALGPGQLNATSSTTGNFNYTPSPGTVPNAGTNLLSLNFTPSDATDYTSANDSVNLVVLPALLTVTASNFSQAYGQPLPTFTGVITGVTNGDNITASYSTSATSNSPPGMYAIVSGFVDPQDRETNYTVRLTNGTLTITQAVPLLNWATPSPVIYGAALGSNQLDATASVSGSFNYAPAAGVYPPPGTNTLSVVFMPSNSTDYVNATDNVSLLVSLVPIQLNIQRAGSNVVLSWVDPDAIFKLQSAPIITGPFTNIPGATDPFTNAVNAAQQYFQLTAPAP